MNKPKGSLPVINAPTVPLEMYHWCASVEHQMPIKVCLKYHLELASGERQVELGCVSCRAITKHVDVYGLRYYRRVPVSETGHALRFTDERTGKLIETTTREWRKIDRLGSTWFTKKIDGESHFFDLYTARNMGIEGAFPKEEPISRVPLAERMAKHVSDHRSGKPVSLPSGKKVHTGGVGGSGYVPSRTSTGNGLRVVTVTRKQKKGLSDLSTGALLSDTAKRLAAQTTDADTLRNKHITTFTSKRNKR